MSLRRTHDTRVVRSRAFLERGKGSFVSVLMVVTAMQGIGVVDRWFAGQYETGFVTAFALADKIVQTLVLSLAVTVATVVFPRLVDRGEEGSVRTGKSLVAVLLLLVPVSSILFAFPRPLIELAYGGGRFSGDSVLTTASLLGVMGLGVVPFGIVWSLPRRLQAVGKYSVQAGMSMVLLVLNVILKIALTSSFGSLGVPLSTVIAYAVVAALYFGYLRSSGLLLIPPWGRKWVIGICGSSVLVALGFRYVAGPDAEWWVPFVCFAMIWVLMISFVGKEMLRELTPSKGRA